MDHEDQPIILLIDDDPVFIYLIERYGQRSGTQIISTGDVDHVVSLVQHERPVIVLLNLMLRTADSWRVLHTLKAEAPIIDIPIVTYSALVDEARARAEGADYFLWKPVMYLDFLAALTSLGVAPPQALAADGDAPDEGAYASV